MKSVHEKLAQIPGLSKPRREAMSNLFCTLLSLRGKANYLNLSRYADCDEKTLRRLAQKPFPFETLNTHLAAQALSGPCILAGDATFVPKSGKKTYGLAWFWNGCHNRSERGLEVSALALIDAHGQAMTLTAQQTPALSTDASRLAFYLEQLEGSKPYWPEGLRYAVFDGLYTTHDFVAGVCRMGLEMVGKLRHDADLKYLYTGEQKAKGRKRKYDGKVFYDDMSRFEALGEIEEDIHAWVQTLWHVSLKRTVRVVLLLNAKQLQKQSHVLLFSTDLTLSCAEIIGYYGARFGIEFLFRDAKQHLGFKDCQARNQKALDFHFNLSLSALNFAKAEALSEVELGQPLIFSMYSHKCRAFNERLMDRVFSKFGLDPTLIKRHPAYPELREYGVIAS
jgi:hypothetical protein